MDLHINSGSQTTRKRWLHLTTGIMMALLVIFTLLSNTLYAMTLPKVATQPASPGQLDQTFKGSAVMKAAEVRELSGTAGWKVEKVLVKAGDRVTKGQELIQYVNTEAQNQLLSEKTALSKLQLSIQKLEYDYIQAEHGEDKGIILSAKAAIEAAKLDIGLQEQQIAEMQTQLVANQVLRAPFDGLVTEVNAQDGLQTKAGSPDVELSDTQQGYRLDLTIPVTFTYGLAVGAKLDVKLPEQNNRVLSGMVIGMESVGIGIGTGAGGDVDSALPPTETYRLSLQLQDASLVGGERAEVAIMKKGKADTLLVSKTAVRSDPMGSYVYTIEERKGSLGNAFHAVRRTVEVVDSNEQVMAIEGLFPQENVIVESSEPLLEGSRVRVVTE